ncbi:MAG: cell division FtsA domain-containing protein, partial [Vicinamibacteria bacterium]|nr:cell division FtsA domain-containing protein [Vicinamibacteria bacterium]
MATGNGWTVADSPIETLLRSGPYGVDVGTSKIVAARGKGTGQGHEAEMVIQLNAFIPVPYSRVTEMTLEQNGIPHYRDNEELVVYGTPTERFANMFNAEARRPMADGLLNPKEQMATNVLEAIVRMLVPRASNAGDVLAFSVPAPAEGRETVLTFHEATLRRFFESLGYRAMAINEGLSVVFAELEDQNFTGIGISCGGGLCNIALAYLSIPSLMFSLPKGGDYIDNAVGSVVDEHATRVKALKEEGLDLSRAPRDKFEKALHIYYEDLVEGLVDTLRRAISQAKKLPRFERPLPIVLAGGTAKPRGFREMFERVLRSRP